MPTPVLEFGSSTINITPLYPIPLAGFAYRNNQPSTGIASELYLKAFVFRVDDQTKCLLIADILWWPPELINCIRKYVQQRWHINAANLLLHATHTHCAPQVSSQFTSGVGLLDEEWQWFFLERIHNAISEALIGLGPARILRYRGKSHISKNRRVEKGIDPATDDWPKGIIDRELTTILIQGMNNEPLGVLVHHACHPTILRGTEVSAEFPGVMCKLISGKLANDCTVGYLQGCCGDIGPLVERSGTRANDTYQEVERIGHILATDALLSLEGAGEAITPDSRPGYSTELPLPFEQLPTVDELTSAAKRNDYIGEWARILLSRGSPITRSAPFEIQQLPLGVGLSLVAFNAELVSHYGLLVKSLSDDTALPCAYSNGMIGYVVTDNQLENGGYEVDESTKYFALPSRFRQGNQRLIEESLIRLLRPIP